MQKEQAKLENAQSHLHKGTRPNSHVICAQIYTIKLFEFFTFYVVLDFYSHTHTPKKKKKSNVKTMHIKRCMMHKCMTMKHLMHERSYKDRKN